MTEAVLLTPRVLGFGAIAAILLTPLVLVLGMIAFGGVAQVCVGTQLVRGELLGVEWASDGTRYISRYLGGATAIALGFLGPITLAEPGVITVLLPTLWRGGST